MKDLDRLLEPRWIVFDLLNPYLIDISPILDVQEEEDDYYNINTVLHRTSTTIYSSSPNHHDSIEYKSV